MLYFSRDHEAETSDVLIIYIVLVCHWPASILFNYGSTFSYMCTYFATRFHMMYDCMCVPIHVSITMGESLVVDKVS